MRFVENLSKELEGLNIAINAIAPGPVNTRMLNEVLDSGPEKVGKIFYEKSLLQKRQTGQTSKKLLI